MAKTKAQLEKELADALAAKVERDRLLEAVRVNDIVKLERLQSNEMYAIKLVEKIVFGMVGLMLMALIGAIIAGVMK